MGPGGAMSRCLAKMAVGYSIRNTNCWKRLKSNRIDFRRCSIVLNVIVARITQRMHGVRLACRCKTSDTNYFRKMGENPVVSSGVLLSLRKPRGLKLKCLRAATPI